MFAARQCVFVSNCSQDPALVPIAAFPSDEITLEYSFSRTPQ